MDTPSPAAVFLGKAREDAYLAKHIEDDPNVSVEQVGLSELAIEWAAKVISGH